MDRLRIASLNSWKCDGDYHRRLDLMAAGLAALDLDAVALQEVFAAPALGLDTARRLAGPLGMTAVALPLRAKPRRVGGRMVASTSGVAVLSRWPVTSSRPVPLTADAEDGERAALVVELDVRGVPLAFASLHLTHLRGRDELRRRQLAEVLAALDPWPRAVAAGDFNAPADAFRLEGGRFTDMRSAVAAAPRPTLAGGGPGDCIDHILAAGVRPARWFTALDTADADGHRPSDHLAVVAELAL